LSDYSYTLRSDITRRRSKHSVDIMLQPTTPSPRRQPHMLLHTRTPLRTSKTPHIIRRRTYRQASTASICLRIRLKAHRPKTSTHNPQSLRRLFRQGVCAGSAIYTCADTVNVQERSTQPQGDRHSMHACCRGEDIFVPNYPRCLKAEVRPYGIARMAPSAMHMCPLAQCIGIRPQ
jgi:hypothetical protein